MKELVLCHTVSGSECERSKEVAADLCMPMSACRCLSNWRYNVTNYCYPIGYHASLQDAGLTMKACKRLFTRNLAWAGFSKAGFKRKGLK